MSWQVIVQPDNGYAIWSSITDSFLYLNLTRKEVIGLHLREEKRNYEERCEQVKTRLGEVFQGLDAGDRPYAEFAHSWDEALSFTASNNGEEKLAETMSIYESGARTLKERDEAKRKTKGGWLAERMKSADFRKALIHEEFVEDFLNLVDKEMKKRDITRVDFTELTGCNITRLMERVKDPTISDIINISFYFDWIPGVHMKSKDTEKSKKISNVHELAVELEEITNKFEELTGDPCLDVSGGVHAFGVSFETYVWDTETDDRAFDEEKNEYAESVREHVLNRLTDIANTILKVVNEEKKREG